MLNPVHETSYNNKLKSKLSNRIPSWQEVLSNPSIYPPSTIKDTIYEVLKRFSLSVNVTTEYTPEHSNLNGSVIEVRRNRVGSLIIKE